MIILYCDFYIIKDSLNDLEKNSDISKRFNIEFKLRSTTGAYKFKEKIDVCKYMIDSYSVIDWGGVCIRFECEDKSQELNFHEYVKLKFPNAEVFTSRSDSAYKYIKHLELIREKYGNPWVFYAPNNDHIFISNNNNIDIYLDYLENIERKYKSYVVSLYYSHFTEMMNIKDSSKILWGDGLIFPKLVFEDENVLALKMNRFCCDSIQIFRLETILNIFKETKKIGKIIRLENTEFYLSSKIKSVIIIPKKELFRHYDGYYHRDCWVGQSQAPSPLFIPDGFFENKIQIRFGYNNNIEGTININQNEQILSYEESNKPDLNCAIAELPYFWMEKIQSISINNNFNPDDHSIYINSLKIINPFWNISKINLKFYQIYFISRSFKYRILNNIRYYLFVKLRNKKIIWKIKRIKKLFC
jgi:hypothetical protein